MAVAPRLALAIALLLVSPLACQRESEGPKIEKIEKTKEEITKTKKEPDPEPKRKVTEPVHHRAVGEPCPRETKRVPFAARQVTPDGPECKANADCKEHKNGRCSANGTCTYDYCYVDADCHVDGGKGGLCVCSEEGTRGYSCLGGNCSVDADCGKDFCSPSYTIQCGPFRGYSGYYCHTAQDKCGNDGDCKNDSGHGYCAYSTELGYWACGYGVCAG